jgi:glutathione synthase/RimK-type ligase-like ATP-grasp enzyme
MRTVLIFSQREDFHSLSVAQAIEQLGGRSVHLNREDYGQSWTISSTSSTRGFDVIVEIEHSTITIDDQTSIFNRRDFTVESQTIPAEIDAAVGEYISEQRAIHVNSILQALAPSTKMMNKPASNRAANSKLAQLWLARELGLRIPNTFIGGSPLLAKEFQDSTTSNLIIKPLEGLHIKTKGGTFAHYTTSFERRNEKDLASISQCPIILQENIAKKTELRVTGVGEELFACSIDTSAASADAKLDWRHFDWANTPHFRAELSTNIRCKLIAFMNRFDVSYGAFDLIVTPEEEIVFLEMNSMGQWLWIEDMTELPISKAIADWLLSP